MPSNSSKPTPAWPEGKTPATLHELYRCLEVCRACSADEARQFVASLPDDKRPDTPKAVAIELIKAGKLTRFQAQAVLTGKIKYLSFGEYVVLERLGRGGMGEVLKAEHRRMQRTVALKVISGSAMKDADAVKRFQREVHAAARLIHPNIVTAFDANEHEGVHFLVMEYVEGRDLAAVLHDQGPLPVATAIDYMLQAARGLAYAHGKGIVHRDIKPGNLLVDREGTVKILDMGLARIDLGPGGSMELTGTGQVMGTVDYMAPEQAEDTHSADARADIYSLGCTLYRLVSGEPLYGGESVVKKLLAHRGAPIPPLGAVCPAASAALDAVFRKMVAKRPEERQQSMAQVVAELDNVLRGLSAAEPTVSSKEVTTDLKLSEFFAAIGPQSGKPGQTATALKSAAKMATGNEVTQDFAKGDTTTSGLAALGSAAIAGQKTANKGPGTGSKTVGRRSLRGLVPPYVIAIAAALGGLALAATGIVVFLPTNDGTIRVEINDPSIEVTVSGSGYKIKGKTEEIHVKPGEHTLHVKTGELEFDTSTFVLGKGENPPLKVELLPGKVQVADGTGRKLGESPRPVMRVAEPPEKTHDFALQFKGTRGSTGDLPVPFEGTGDLTVEAWVTVERFVGYTSPIHGRDACLRMTRPPGKNEGICWDGILILEDQQNHEGMLCKGNRREVSVGEPVHVALVRRNGVHTTYVNGRGDSSRSQWGDYPNLSSMWDVNFPLKTNSWTLSLPDVPFHGCLDEIRISRVARYRSDFVPADRFEPDADTLALYHCNEGQRNILKDSSGNARDGILRDVAWIEVGRNHLPASDSGAGSIGWMNLFNGRDLYGWLQKGHAGWSVKDGLLTGESVGAVGWLMSDREFGDFELELEYRLPPGGNGGVFLRAPENGMITGGEFNEIQLLDDAAPKFANVLPKGRNGALFNQIAPTKAPIKAANEWRKLSTRVVGSRVQATLDGVEILDGPLRAGTPARGHIGLQLYSPGIAVRNIRIREQNTARSSSAVVAPRTIDLLPLIDLKRDVVSGQWRLTLDGLVVEATPQVGADRARRLQLPYSPPEEYDFEIEVTPAAGPFRTTQRFWAAGRSISWEYDSKPGAQPRFTSGFALLDGMQVNQSPESLMHDTQLLATGRRSRSRIEVRRGSLRVFLNDKEIIAWQGDLTRFSDSGQRDELPDPRRLGLMTHKPTATFHKISVREVTGRGSFVTTVDAAGAR